MKWGLSEPIRFIPGVHAFKGAASERNLSAMPVLDIPNTTGWVSGCIESVLAYLETFIDFRKFGTWSHYCFVTPEMDATDNHKYCLDQIYDYSSPALTTNGKAFIDAIFPNNVYLNRYDTIGYIDGSQIGYFPASASDLYNAMRLNDRVLWDMCYVLLNNYMLYQSRTINFCVYTKVKYFYSPPYPSDPDDYWSVGNSKQVKVPLTLNGTNNPIMIFNPNYFWYANGSGNPSFDFLIDQLNHTYIGCCVRTGINTPAEIASAASSAGLVGNMTFHASFKITSGYGRGSEITDELEVSEFSSDVTLGASVSDIDLSAVASKAQAMDVRLKSHYPTYSAKINMEIKLGFSETLINSNTFLSPNYTYKD